LQRAVERSLSRPCRLHISAYRGHRRTTEYSSHTKQCHAWSMMTSEFARQFAHEWIAAWNAHDLAQVLSHYTDDFEMSSPFIVQFPEDASGTDKCNARSRSAPTGRTHCSVIPTYVSSCSMYFAAWIALQFCTTPCSLNARRKCYFSTTRNGLQSPRSL
jgi:hypothetical protein